MSAPLRIREAVVVEGRYDKSTLAGVVDTLILETSGFGVFSIPERQWRPRNVRGKTVCKTGHLGCQQRTSHRKNGGNQ